MTRLFLVPLFALSELEEGRRNVDGEIQKRIVLLRRHLARQASHLRLKHPAEDGRDDGVRRRRRCAATPRVRRDVLASQDGQVSGQKRQELGVKSVQHVAKELVRIL